MNTVINSQVQSVSELDGQLSGLREQMRQLNAARIAQLPRVSTEERGFLCDVETSVERSEETAKRAGALKKDRQFTEEDRDQLAAARMAHRKEINCDAIKAEAARYVGQAYLHSYKLTHRKDGKVGLTLKGVI